MKHKGTVLTLVEYRSLRKQKKEYQAPVYVEGAGVLFVHSSELLRSPGVQQQLAAAERLRLSRPFL